MLYQGCFFRVLAREAILIRISKKDVLFENLYGNRNKQTYRQRAVGLLFFFNLVEEWIFAVFARSGVEHVYPFGLYFGSIYLILFLQVSELGKSLWNFKRNK